MNTISVTPILAAGSTTTPYIFQVNISKRLCTATCTEQVPVFAPAFSLLGFSNVGTDAYVATIRVQGVVSYIPCNGTPCCTRTEAVSQLFTIPFQSGTAPTAVSITTGATINAVGGSSCHPCSRDFVSETPLYLSVA